jgi:hypothetical protein
MLERKQRAVREDVKRTRAALKVVVPINRQIGPWQSRTAKLVHIAQKLRASGGYNPAVLEEVEVLATTVEVHQQQLLEQARDLPPEIAGNGRLIDTARALKGISSGLEQARSLLGASHYA